MEYRELSKSTEKSLLSENWLSVISRMRIILYLDTAGGSANVVAPRQGLQKICSEISAVITEIAEMVDGSKAELHHWALVLETKINPNTNVCIAKCRTVAVEARYGARRLILFHCL